MAEQNKETIKGDNKKEEKEEKVYNVVYISRAENSVDQDVVHEIVKIARDFNSKQDITASFLI